MYVIKTLKGYLTRTSISSEYSYTQNVNLAYTFDDLEQAEAIITYLGIIAEIKCLK